MTVRQANSVLGSRSGTLFLLKRGNLFLGRGGDIYDVIHNWDGRANGDADRYHFPDGSCLRVDPSSSERWADSCEPVVRLVPELFLADPLSIKPRKPGSDPQ